MKLTKNTLSSTVLFAGLSFGAMGVPAISFAEVETTLHVHTINMFRGQDESGGAPAFHGEIEYSHDSGVYVGTEIVNTAEHGGGVEWDITYGFAKEFNKIKVDAGFVHYLFPMAKSDHDDDPYTADRSTPIDDTAETEFKIGVGYENYNVAYYINTDSENDYTYLSLDYDGGKFGVHYGITSTSVSDDNYNDIAVTYGLTKDVVLTLSNAFGNAVGNKEGQVESDMLIMLTYTIPLGDGHDMHGK